ncbi:MAG: PfkB family carbohydrate kinase, partial [Cetobacterium sp.]
KGSIFISEDEILTSGVPNGKLVSSNGSGDSMIAGFIYGFNQNLPLNECYKIGIASGSGTAFSKGLTTFETMNNLLKDIKINKL